VESQSENHFFDAVLVGSFSTEDKALAKKKVPCHRDYGAFVSYLVPGARVELAWISPNDFEFLLNPASRCNFDAICGLELPNFPMAA